MPPILQLSNYRDGVAACGHVDMVTCSKEDKMTTNEAAPRRGRVKDYMTRSEAKELIDQAIAAAFASRKEEQKTIAIEAAKEVMKNMGVFSEPGELPELRKDFAYLRQSRQTAEKVGGHVKLVIVGAVVLAALGALATGILAKIGL